MQTLQTRAKIIYDCSVTVPATYHTRLLELCCYYVMLLLDLRRLENRVEFGYSRVAVGYCEQI